MPNSPAIALERINKWHGPMHVLRDLTLNIAQKERVVVGGPSGSGKSTMIRCINGLETHQGGTIVINGVPLTEDIRALALVRREVGMVFQSFNLFPHLTVLENCTPAPIKSPPNAEGRGTDASDDLPGAGENPRAS